MAADPYSRFVSVLRIALPLIALGILSTLFLFSTSIEPGDTIPFAETEVNQRIRDQRVSGPLFAGVTANGDEISVIAEQMITAGVGGNRATDLTARLDFASGGAATLVADEGIMDLASDTATLQGDVLVESTTGYRLRSDFMTSRLSQLDLVSPGEVRGTGPGGTITAQRMQITAAETGNNVQILFSNGVKLVYDPKNRE